MKPTSPPWAPKVLELLAVQRRNQQWLAAMIGISQTYMTMMINGQRPAKIDHIAAMAHALGVPVAWILPEAGQQDASA